MKEKIEHVEGLDGVNVWIATTEFGEYAGTCELTVEDGPQATCGVCLDEEKIDALIAKLSKWKVESRIAKIKAGDVGKVRYKMSDGKTEGQSSVCNVAEVHDDSIVFRGRYASWSLTLNRAKILDWQAVTL